MIVGVGRIRDPESVMVGGGAEQRGIEHPDCLVEKTLSLLTLAWRVSLCRAGVVNVQKRGMSDTNDLLSSSDRDLRQEMLQAPHHTAKQLVRSLSTAPL